jgi:hypothetical protein
MEVRLSETEIVAIARDVLSRVFKDLPAAAAPVTVAFDTVLDDPDYVHVRVHHPNRTSDIDAKMTLEAMAAINEETAARGDARFFALSHLYGPAAVKAA